MSREKQHELYPEACMAQLEWENGKIDIKQAECLVEGAQPALNYYQQVNGFLDRLPENGIYILCGTRSDTMCLYNIFKNQSPEKDMSYQFYNFGYAESKILSMDRNGQTRVWNLEEINDRLDGLPKEKLPKGMNAESKTKYDDNENEL